MDKNCRARDGSRRYVVKPFSLGELLARVRAQHSRASTDAGAPASSLQSGTLVWTCWLGAEAAGEEN